MTGSRRRSACRLETVSLLTRTWPSGMPEKLAYRMTFISVQDDDKADGAGRRTRSVPSRLEFDEEEGAESRYVRNLPYRRAASFPSVNDLVREPSETRPGTNDMTDMTDMSGKNNMNGIGLNDGSLAHPEVCKRPCVRFLHGNCEYGAACGFCHLEHARAKGKLDKRQRQCFDSLSEQQVLALLLPYITSRSEDQGIAEPMREVVALLREKLSKGPAESVPRSKSNFLRIILKRLTVARLVELLGPSLQADGDFVQQFEEALARARVAVNTVASG